MEILSEDAIVLCTHQLGNVSNEPSQSLVRVDGRRLLVDDDPERRRVRRCPNIGVTVKPCQTTLKVVKGYSELVRIDGKQVCLDSVQGLTDGTPPGIVEYRIRAPGQRLLGSSV